MNILVTGGAGFIGSHLCERLVKAGNKVTCFDNFNSFYSPVSKKANLFELIGHPDFTLIEGDIRFADELDKCFENGEIDLIIHLAAMAGIRPSLDNPELYADVNIMGTHKVLHMCQKHQVKHLIFASSSSVYGSKQGGAFKEDDDLGKPASPYAETKHAGEILTWLWQNDMQIPVVVLRLFTVYGPRQRPDLAIHKFANLLYDNKPIPIYGDGSTSRDYTYIDDTLDGIEKAMEFIQQNSGYHVFNLGESRTIRLIDMVHELEHVTGKKAVLDWQPLQEGDVPYTCADISKSRELLGYNPQVELEEGIRRFIHWFEQNR